MPQQRWGLSDLTEIPTSAARPLSHCVFCGIADYRCYTPTCLSSKTGFGGGAVIEGKARLWSLSCNRGHRMRWHSIANRVAWGRLLALIWPEKFQFNVRFLDETLCLQLKASCLQLSFRLQLCVSWVFSPFFARRRKRIFLFCPVGRPRPERSPKPTALQVP